MAYTKTTWANDPATTSPISADNLNKIEDGLFNQDAEITTGWIPAESMAYASPTTITVASGAVSRYSKGDKLKLTQTTVKYFYIVGVTDTVLTITGGTDYTLVNAAITSPFYSHIENPVGFPAYFNYVPVFSRSTIPFTNAPVVNYAMFKLCGSLLTGTMEFTMPESAGGSGEIGATLPVPVVIPLPSVGKETQITARAILAIEDVASQKLLFITITSPPDNPPITATSTYPIPFNYFI